MKRLSLLRHAKSSWSEPAAKDFDRPLNARGREAAPLMGAFMARRGLVPDLVFCSTSARTRETWKLSAPKFGAEPTVELRDDLYLADPKRLLAAIRSADANASHLLVVAHNPGLEMLALQLADPDRSDGAALSRIASKFPTAALAHFEGPSQWTDFRRDACALRLFATPKEIARSG